MAKRLTTRLRVGGGELVAPGPNARAQWLYLEAVQRCVPEAMRALAVIAPNLPDSGALGTRAREASLREWCNQWGFTAVRHGGDRGDWLLTVARRTAEHLRTQTPNWPEAWVHVVAYRELETVEIVPPRWRPDDETEEDYRKRVDSYIIQIGVSAEREGWSKAPEKRNLEHLEWLARYQVAGWTEAKIAEHYQDENGSPEVPAVSRALTDTARLIGLTLRPAQGREKT